MLWGKQQCDQCFSIQKIVQPTKSIPQSINVYSLRMSQKNPQKVSLKKSIHSNDKLLNFKNKQFKLPNTIQQFVQNPKKHIKFNSKTYETHRKTNTQINSYKTTNMKLSNLKYSYQYPINSAVNYYITKPNLYNHQRISSDLNKNEMYINSYQRKINNFDRISLKEVDINQLLPQDGNISIQNKKISKNRLWMPTLKQFDEFDEQENEQIKIVKQQQQNNKKLNGKLKMKRVISQETQNIQKPSQVIIGIKKTSGNQKIQFLY